MSNLKNEYYRIRVKGHISKKWSTWFENMEIAYDLEDTILKGPIVDQAALYGILLRLRDLNLTLLELKQLKLRTQK